MPDTSVAAADDSAIPDGLGKPGGVQSVETIQSKRERMTEER